MAAPWKIAWWQMLCLPSSPGWRCAGSLSLAALLFQSAFSSSCTQIPLELLTFVPFCWARAAQPLNSRWTQVPRCPTPLEGTGMESPCMLMTRGLPAATSLGRLSIAAWVLSMLQWTLPLCYPSARQLPINDFVSAQLALDCIFKCDHYERKKKKK